MIISILLLSPHLLQVAGAEYNASHNNSCVPASSPVSPQQSQKYCHLYPSNGSGYCTHQIGGWLVNRDVQQQQVIEFDLNRYRTAMLVYEKSFKHKITKPCLETFDNILCRWVFPKCDLTTAKLTSQPICKETCEYLASLCAAEIELLDTITLPGHLMFGFTNCSAFKTRNGGQSPKCFYARYLNTETDKLKGNGCFYGNGLVYGGNVNVTRSGHVCQSWSSQCPHRHDYLFSEYPELVNASNSCRNPGGQAPDGPWCYTTNRRTRWEYCDVQRCPPPVPSQAPVIVQANARGPNSLFVAWRPVPLPFIHGQPRGFRIFIKTPLDAAHDGEGIINTTGSEASSMEYNHLKPTTNYSLTVLVFNENGDGPHSTAVYVKTLPENFISIKFILTLKDETFSHFLLNKESQVYQKLASLVQRTVTEVLKTTKPKEYNIFQVEISKFLNSSVRVEFYVTAEVLESLSPSYYTIVQDITGRILNPTTRNNTGKIDFSSLVVEASPPPPANVSQSDIRMTSVTVKWLPPNHYRPYRISSYTVQYKKAKTEMPYYEAVTVNSNKTQVNIKHLDLDTKYLVRVVSTNAYGSKGSQPILVKTRAKSGNTVLIASLSVSVAGVAAILITTAILRKRWNERKTEHQTQLKPTIVFETLGIDIIKDWWEIPREDLEIQEQLGSGSFGVVMKAYLTRQEDGREITTLCAVKMLKENPTDNELRDLCNELNLMTIIGEHPNVISLIGACTLHGPPWLVIKYAMNGCLHDYLWDKSKSHIYANMSSGNYDEITRKEKLKFALDIAQGMAHFENERVVHRDLASRNILLGENMVAMVSDFGLSRNIYEVGVYENTTGGRLPVRWMALESLENFTYTTESDVWSYGVVLWEIENEGQMPYAGMTNGKQILEHLIQGHRLENQKNTPQDIEAIMQECWNPYPKQRPTFSNLVNKMSELYQKYMYDEELGGGNSHEETEYVELEVDHHDNAGHHDEEIELEKNVPERGREERPHNICYHNNEDVGQQADYDA